MDDPSREKTLESLPPAPLRPCRECPWLRDSAPGWLGPHSAIQWLEIVHSEAPIACHLTIIAALYWLAPGIKQCKGAAVFRANVSKSPRDPSDAAHGTDQDRESVFSWDDEFLAHHTHRGGSAGVQLDVSRPPRHACARRSET